MQTMIFIRGLPGSGKSTLARTLKWKGNAVHIEADMFHEDEYGNYFFKPENITAAHEWCRKTADDILKRGDSVIVSNTFTMKWELKPYFKLAQKYGIVPTVLICNGDFGSIHNVPEEVLINMKNRFQYDISDLYKEVNYV